MKIAIIQGSSQKDKNSLIYNTLVKVVKDKDHEVINFGVFSNESKEYSYIETALLISMLVESNSVDFVITGCSSGQGMMLACNSLPSILCGYIGNPSDAYLFGRINNGNTISIPLGLNFGWAAEINLECIFEKLFQDSFGIGYPKEDSERKKKDTNLLKEFNFISKRTLKDIIPKIDKNFMKKVVSRDNVFKYIVKHGQDTKLIEILKLYR